MARVDGVPQRSCVQIGDGVRLLVDRGGAEDVMELLDRLAEEGSICGDLVLDEVDQPIRGYLKVNLGGPGTLTFLFAADNPAMILDVRFREELVHTSVVDVSPRWEEVPEAIETFEYLLSAKGQPPVFGRADTAKPQLLATKLEGTYQMWDRSLLIPDQDGEVRVVRAMTQNSGLCLATADGDNWWWVRHCLPRKDLLVALPHRPFAPLPSCPIDHLTRTDIEILKEAIG